MILDLRFRICEMETLISKIKVDGKTISYR